MKSRLVVPEGYEIRSELIRLYPDQEAHKVLRQLQCEMRDVINHIIRCRDDVKAARRLYALKNSIGGPPPIMPEKPKYPTPKTPEEKKVVREAWKHYHLKVRETWSAWSAWYKAVDRACKNVPELAWRNDTYKDVRKIYGKVGNMALYRDTCERVSNVKRAQSKSKYEWVPLVWRNDAKVKTGEFYENRRGIPWYNAFIILNGSKQHGKIVNQIKIVARLQRPLPGPQIPGVSIVKYADGLYAAVKCLVPKRGLKQPVLEPVGVDVGQTDLVALSDGYTEPNIRNSVFASEIAAIQELADKETDSNKKQDYWNQIGRKHQKWSRRIQHWINADLLPRLERHSLVFVEKLAKGFKSNKGPLSCMHRILDAIKKRLGDRVVEVMCAGTSQECSSCGNHAPEARKGKIYSCSFPNCMVLLDADFNASRNILRRGLESLRT